MTEVSAIARLKDYFFNDDYTEFVVFERYRDFAAMREHLANIGDDIMQALLKVCSMSGGIFAHARAEESDRRARHPALLAVPAE
jgi:hypothetical protein